MKKAFLLLTFLVATVSFAEKTYAQKLSSSPKREYLLSDSVYVPYAMKLATMSVSGSVPVVPGGVLTFINLTAEYFVLDKFSIGVDVSVNQREASAAMMASAYAYDAFGFLPNFLVPYFQANVGVGGYYDDSHAFPVFLKYGGGVGCNIMFAKFGGLKVEMGVYAENLSVYPAPKIGMYLIF